MSHITEYNHWENELDTRMLQNVYKITFCSIKYSRRNIKFLLGILTNTVSYASFPLDNYYCLEGNDIAEQNLR